ncbi:M23 family peptidase [Paenibacillus sp. H1-7]|uniref:M23 family metallopeptidase n=1 Tax=Paenibacillus sp. H1-7 TaxID=2282849 RepID=UPI001EF87CF8|nr:M23 family metallopeptidase [Paenibacillus sp. H1-7]ULL15616.1 M23 family peptidase [Paenibacillus sp. H1-7]
MDYITSWKKNQWLVVSCCLMTVLVVVFSSVYVYMYQHIVTRYQVFVGTEHIGAVSDQALVNDWLARKQQQIKLQNPTVQAEMVLGDVHFVKEQEYKAAFNNEQVLASLEKRARVRTSGVQIQIDGVPLGIVKDEQAVNRLLDRYKSKYVPAAEAGAEGGGGQLVSAEWTQKVELAAVEIQPEQVDESEALLNKIETGGMQPITYTVQRGDCISCIAHKFGISQQVIYSNNPSIKSTVIRVGDVLDLTVMKPLLSLKTVEKHNESVEIPFTTAYIEEPEMKAGSFETVTAGEKGVKSVDYLTTKINGELISESVGAEIMIQPAKQAVVKKGTKVIPGVGTGSFAWPVFQAQLTSEFGQRWGRLHPGTDMVSEQTGILASDHGKTVFAGWKSGYGNCIIIDHQNGYSTLYGHLSKISVTEGENVQKGEKIGVMGRTGNATGVHLHFEVRKGDSQLNPLKFLGKAAS